MNLAICTVFFTVGRAGLLDGVSNEALYWGNVGTPTNENSAMKHWWVAALLAIVPGLGHVYLGKFWRGIVVFFIFSLAVNGIYFAVVTGYPSAASGVFACFAGAACAMLAYSVLHTVYLARRTETASRRERKDYHFRRGMVQYIAGAFEPAKTEFEAVLKLDPMDIDARFHLGMTLAALGDHRTAAKQFKRCLSDDINHKWSWEVKRQMEQMSG